MALQIHALLRRGLVLARGSRVPLTGRGIDLPRQSTAHEAAQDARQGARAEVQRHAGMMLRERPPRQGPPPAGRCAAGGRRGSSAEP